ncbi:MAG: sigma-70 family RNA polymerase sigma factor [Planctomycetes bacterium]|nr:sigma-70 family RNA polymerase sigma factor [Planctomycetota bacterium]
MEIEPIKEPSPLDEVLAEEGFIRSLARKLARDDELANDVFQETLLAAIKRPRKSNAPLRSWIARVVHNRVVQTHRHRLRREKHEALLDEAPGELSPADAAERDGVRAHVVRAVEEMDEPYRSAILLRFYEDLEPREMAARLGVPVETARTRVKRAMALLRARLDREYGNDTPRWASSLFLWTLPDRGATLVVAESGASAVRWATGVIAVVGCAVLLWLALDRAPTREAPVAALPPGPTASVEVASTAGASSASNAAARAENDGPTLPPLAVRVVRRDDGTPLAGVRFVFTAIDGRELERSTDDDGAASIPWPTDRALAVAIDATDGTLATHARLAPEERAERSEPWTIAVEGSTEVEGRAIDRFGQSLAGASVSVFALDEEDLPLRSEPALARATADLAGTFRFDHLPRRFALLVESPERIAADVWIANLSRARRLGGLEVVLDDPAPVRGEVLDSDGNAVAGASLTLARVRGDADFRSSSLEETWFRARDEFEATSEYDGRFEFARVPRGRYQLAVAKHGLATFTRNVQAPLDDVSVRLEEAAPLAFLVVDADGKALADARALVRRSANSERGAARARETARADAEGRLTLDGASAGTAAWLRVEAVGHATVLAGPFDIVRGDSARTLVLDSGRALSGSVRDDLGTPFANCVVIARASPASEDLERFAVGHQNELFELARTRANADGEFRFPELARVDLELEIRATERAAPAHAESVSRTATHVDVRLRSDRASGVTLAGRVHARGSAELVSGFVVSALPSDTAERTSRVTVRGAAGDDRFELALGAEGEWLVHVRAPGYAPWERLLPDLEPGLRVLDVELLPERSVDVRVVDRRGRPVPYATLAVADVDERPLAISLHAGERRSAVQVGPRGEARLVGLPAGEVRIHVSTPLVRDATTFELDLSRSDVGAQTFVLDGHDTELVRRWLALTVVASADETSRLRVGPPDDNAPDWNGRVRVTVRDAAGQVQLALSGTLEDGRLRSDANRLALYVQDGEDGAVDNGWLQELRPNWGAPFGREFFPSAAPFDALPIPAADAVLELELDGEVLTLALPLHAADGARVVAVTAEAASLAR